MSSSRTLLVRVYGMSSYKTLLVRPATRNLCGIPLRYCTLLYFNFTLLYFYLYFTSRYFHLHLPLSLLYFITTTPTTASQICQKQSTKTVNMHSTNTEVRVSRCVCVCVNLLACLLTSLRAFLLARLLEFSWTLHLSSACVPMSSPGPWVHYVLFCAHLVCIVQVQLFGVFFAAACPSQHAAGPVGESWCCRRGSPVRLSGWGR
jgi:hypothetical protein